MADFIGHVVSGLLTHANNSAVGICATVGEFVHRRAMVIAGILRYAAEQGGAMSAGMMKVWADFWAGQASMVVSTSPPLSAEESKAVIRNIASNTSSNSSSSTTTEGTASDNNSSNSSGGGNTNSTANAQRAFFAGKRRRKAKRRTSSAKPSIQHLHEKNSKDAAGTAAPFSASAQPAAPATSPVVPGTTTGAARPS